MQHPEEIPQQPSAWEDDRTVFVAFSQAGVPTRPNEDRYLIHRLRDGSVLLAVADGLGGNVSGGVAAQIVQKQLKRIDTIEVDREEKTLFTIAREIDRHIHRIKEADPAIKNAGSTLLAVLLRQNGACWVHVGDSRLYLLRNGTLAQITKDQTLARFLVEESEITDQEALTHYSRHVMDQWVGCGDVTPETGRLELAAKDLLILSSDGFYKYVPEDFLSATASRDMSLEARAGMLVRAAIERGGTDDITIVLAKRK